MTILNTMLSIPNGLMYMLTTLMLQGENPPPPPTTMSNDPNVPGDGGTAIDETPIDEYTALAFVIAILIGMYYFWRQKHLDKMKNQQD